MRHCSFHALHYTEPQAGIFVFVAVFEKERKTEKIFLGEVDKLSQPVYHQVVRRISEELKIRGKQGLT